MFASSLKINNYFIEFLHSTKIVLYLTIDAGCIISERGILFIRERNTQVVQFCFTIHKPKTA